MFGVLRNDKDTLAITIQLDEIMSKPAAGKSVRGLSKDKARSNILGFDDLFHCYVAPVTQCRKHSIEIRGRQNAHLLDHVLVLGEIMLTLYRHVSERLGKRPYISIIRSRTWNQPKLMISVTSRSLYNEWHKFAHDREYNRFNYSYPFPSIAVANYYIDTDNLLLCIGCSELTAIQWLPNSSL